MKNFFACYFALIYPTIQIANITRSGIASRYVKFNNISSEKTPKKVYIRNSVPIK